MELKDLQKMVDEKIGIFGGYWKPLEMFAALAEEAGEVGRELNSIYGPKKKRVESSGLESEMGDLLYALVCIANAEKIDLEKCFLKSINKSLDRDKDRFK